MPREISEPRSPLPKKRNLNRIISDPKLENPKKKAISGNSPLYDLTAGEEVTKTPASASPEPGEFETHLHSHCVTAAARQRLLPQLRRWSKARAEEVLGLWTFLGDGGVSRPVSTPTLQVWGPPGTGKTAVVFGFLGALGIRHVRLNCACFASAGELQGRLAEELRRLAVAALGGGAADTAPRELLRQAAPGRQLRPLDRLEAAVRLPLQILGERGISKVVIALDQAEELPRLGAGLLQLLLTLPEVLQQGSMLTVVTISRLPLGSLGLLPAREPPAVAFRPYSEAEAEGLLLKLLQRTPAAPNAPDLHTLCCSGLMKFAAPALGRNLHHLLSVGEEILAEPDIEVAAAPGGAAAAAPGGAAGALARKGTGSVASLQRRVELAVQQRVGLCDLRGLLQSGEAIDHPQTDAATATVRMMTEVDKRLVLAAYFGAHIDKDDDMQLFLPEGKRRRKRGSVTKTPHGEEDVPIYCRVPRPVTLVRLMAIYHRLARQPQLLGPPLFERLMGLREAGLIRFVGDRHSSIDREPRIICRAELPLVQACAGDLDIDLNEYLCDR